MTVLEIIEKSSAYLNRRRVDAPRLQSEQLVAHLLKVPRLQLYLDSGRELSSEQVAACRELVRRRGLRIPLQHLVGSVSFYGFDIQVNAHALIPRPETELLVECAEKLIRDSVSPASTVLDVGTGTGCIAIALAARNPHIRLAALDISSDALTLARANADRHQVGDRIDFVHGDGIEALSTQARFDVIVSNPPYIARSEIANLQPEVRDHDPRLALDGGSDGLDFYRRLSVHAAGRLASGGAMVLEIGDEQADRVTQILSSENWIVEPPVQDYSGRERCLITRSQQCTGGSTG